MSDIEESKEAFAKRVHEILDEMDFAKRGRAQRIKREGKFDISDRAINKWLSGESMPDHHNLEALSNFLNVNFNWLAAGQGEKSTTLSLKDLKSQMESIQKKSKGSSKALLAGHELASIDDEEQSDMVPVISWVAAGSWTETMAVTLDDVITQIPRFPGMSPNVFGLVIRGRSMMPQFKPGDIIYVDPSITPWELQDGDLIVVQCSDGHEATFKQLIIGETSDDMYLKPLNPEWPEQKMIPMGECILKGKAVKKVESL